MILVGGEPIGVKFKDFDTFASGVKLQTQMGCEEFSNSKNRDVHIKKYFEIKENVSLEPICLTPEQFGEWILSPRKYKKK